MNETMLDLLKDIRIEIQTIRQCGINQDEIVYHLKPLYESLYSMAMELSELSKIVKGVESNVDVIAESQRIGI